MRRRRGGMEGVGQIVSRVMPGRRSHDTELLAINGFWCRSVPERVAENARPVRLRAGVLTIHTRTSAWANTLQLEGDSLLKAFRSRYPTCRVSRLVFRTGRLPSMPLPPRPPPPKAPVMPLSQLPEEVAARLALIQNDELRDAIRRAASMGLSPRGAQAKPSEDP